METNNAWTAEALINTTVEKKDGSEVISELQKKKEMLEADERATVSRYISEMRPIYAAMLVDNLGGNTAGLYNGSRTYIDTNVVMVGASVDRTIAQSREVFDHEQYHAEGDHTAPLTVMADTRGDIAAVIGGVEFTETALIEGLTVAKTGDQFVSAEYVDYKETLLEAVSKADLNLSDVENAVNKQKDVTLIDDRANHEAVTA